MNRLVKAVSADGMVRAYIIDSTEMVARLEQVHKSSAVITAALGRLTTAASIMGSLQKGERDSVTLRFSGGGPSGLLIAVSDSGGNARSYVEQPIVELPLNKVGKLDVSGAVGKNGSLYVVRDLGMNEPYSGQTPIVSGEIAEDIAHYYALSEQVPTVCSLGVLVNPNLTVAAAGGFLIQLMPGAEETVILALEENISATPPVSSLIHDGKTPEDILELVLKGFSPTVLGESFPEYRCDCSRDRMQRAMLSLSLEELQRLSREEKESEVYCHFCGRKEYFDTAWLVSERQKRGRQ